MFPIRATYLLPSLLWLVSGTAQAEFIGLNIGASHWAPAQSGLFNPTNNSSMDLIDDLGSANPPESSMVLILEHPIRALPNLRYQGFNLGSSGTTTPGSDINFYGETLSSGNQISSTFDLSHDEIVLYYQLLGNRLNLDLGLDLKRFDGAVSLSGSSNTSFAVDETIPLLYLSARFDLPYNGFYVGANINSNFSSLNIGRSTAEDSTIMLGYDSGNGLGLEGGIKYYSFELDDSNNLDTNLKYDGVYFNGYLNF